MQGQDLTAAHAGTEQDLEQVGQLVRVLLRVVPQNAAASFGVQQVRSSARGLGGTQCSAGLNFSRHDRTAWFSALRSVETTR